MAAREERARFPCPRSPQGRSSLAAEGAERSRSSGLGECLICGIPQIIRAAGNVGQGRLVPSPAPLLVLQEAAKVALGRETWGLRCGGETPAPLTSSGSLSPVPPAPALDSRESPALSTGTFPWSLASPLSTSLVPHELSEGSLCPNPPHGLRECVPSLCWPRGGEEAELPTGSPAAAVSGAGQGLSASPVPFGPFLCL